MIYQGHENQSGPTEQDANQQAHSLVVFTTADDETLRPLSIGDGIHELLGYTPDEWLRDPVLWRQVIHPADRHSVVDEKLRGDDVFFKQYRMLARDGRVIAIREQTFRIKPGRGIASYRQGSYLDVSADHAFLDQMREVEERYRALVEEAPAVTYRSTHDEHGGVIYVSPQLRQVLGYEPQVWLDDPTMWTRLVHPEDVGTVQSQVDETYATGQQFETEYRIQAADGRWVWLQSTASLIRDHDGEPLYWQGVLVDITRQKEAEAAHEALEVRYSNLLKNAHDVIIVLDRQEQLTFANPAFEHLTGYRVDEFSSLSIVDLTHPDDIEDLRAGIARVFALEQQRPEHEFRLIHRDGSVRYVEANASPIVAGDEVVGLQAIIRDVTDRQKLEQKLVTQAFHDDLTGLPNRAQFRAALQECVAKADPATVLFLDLDNFKIVNDSLGHEAGDELLIEVAGRLVDMVRGNDLVARISGDEFAVLLSGTDGSPDGELAAQRILTALRLPISLREKEITQAASIGIADMQPGQSEDDVLRQADLAMYASKARGKNTYARYERRLETAAQRRLELETDLRAGLRRGELRLVFDSIIDLRTGLAAGIEALVRWEHPRHGLLHPRSFLAIAEESGLIHDLDRWVCEEIGRRASDWRSRVEFQHPLVAVNLSVRSLESPRVIEALTNVCAELNAGPSTAQLVIEISEPELVRASGQIRSHVQELHRLGVKLAVDDFGTGYGALANVRKLAVEYLKIDGEFVRSISHSREDSIIAYNMIEVAHALGIRVVAEGVEDQSQIDALRSFGCDLAQGTALSGETVHSDVPDRLEADDLQILGTQLTSLAR